MSDYIKRENAKRAVWGCSRDTGIDEAPFEYAEGLLEDVPAEDVEPVVRCKDCRWFGSVGCAIRIVDETDMPKENDFCSFAERKDDE